MTAAAVMPGPSACKATTGAAGEAMGPDATTVIDGTAKPQQTVASASCRQACGLTRKERQLGGARRGGKTATLRRSPFEFCFVSCE